MNRLVKIVIGFVLTFIYLVSPIDLIPDFIPVAGQCDDLGVAGAYILYFFLTIFSSPNKNGDPNEK